MYAKFMKRVIDIAISLTLLILLSPILLALSVLVRVKMGTPVIFKQERIGKVGKDGKEKVFTLFKFRTMTDTRDKNGELMPDSQRQCKFGNFIRQTGLDELPELVNVLKGEMAIVGPRPLVVQYLPYYSEEEHHRHDVLPGITGLAQINGRNLLMWEQRFAYDLEYAANLSFFLDIKIIVKTVKKMLIHDGATAPRSNISFDEYRIKQRMGILERVNIP